MRPERAGSRCPTAVKVQLVLRLLEGETLAELARETGRSKRQLSAWRRRFLAGAEASLEGRSERGQLETLRGIRDELSEQVAQLSGRVAELEAENRALARRAVLLGNGRQRRAVASPYCSDAYAQACEEPAARPLRVPEWGACVLVREGREGVRHATGVRPLASLDPACDLQAGLEALRRAGIASVSLITDPMWCPERSALQDAFDACRPFRKHYLVDRSAELRFGKRHRSRIDQARRAGRVRELSLAEHVDRWHELYAQNVANRQIPQPFTPAYFEQLAQLPALQTLAVLVEHEIVAMTLWVRHGDTLYFHDGASSATGFEISATYAAFAHAIEHETDCRYLLLGGAADLRDEQLEGLAMFRRGFSNASAVSYLCSATLSRRAPDPPDSASRGRDPAGAGHIDSYW